ncbi:hypothetical protein [Stenotrophomonas maltophilia]|nr:hypothetical protein [Stenotrophomonas maltophilia]
MPTITLDALNSAAVLARVITVGGQGHWDTLRGEGRTHCELY